MTTSVSGKSSVNQNIQTTNEPDVCSVDSKTSTTAATSTTSATTSKPSPFIDSYAPDDTVNSPSTDASKPLLQSTPKSKAQEFSVKDALVASTSEPNSPTITQSAKDTPKFEEKRDVKILTKLLDDNDGKIPSRLQASLNGVLYDKNANLSSLVDLLDNKTELHKILSSVNGSSPKVADQIIQNLEANVRSRIGEAIAAKVRPQIAEAQKAVAELNKSPESRRQFLCNIASQTGDVATIQQKLQNIGIPSKDANNLAIVLSQAHGNPDKLASIATGDSGPTTLSDWNGTRSEFADTENQLKKLLNKLDSSLNSLHNSVGNGQIKHDRILTNPNFELARNEVLKQLGATSSPPDQVNTLGRIFNEGVANSKRADDRETVLKGAIIDTSTEILDKMKFAAPLTETLKLGLKAPDLIIAYDDVHLANAAHLIGAGTADNIEQKELMKSAVIATTIGDTLIPEFADLNITAEDLVKAKNFADRL